MSRNNKKKVQERREVVDPKVKTLLKWCFAYPLIVYVALGFLMQAWSLSYLVGYAIINTVVICLIMQLFL
jgi:hypothetical protein